MVNIADEMNGIAQNVHKYGLTTYLVIFICGSFVFSNFLLTGKINSMITRMDKIIEKQIVLDSINERTIKNEIIMKDMNQKLDYLILKINNDETYLKKRYETPKAQS